MEPCFRLSTGPTRLRFSGEFEIHANLQSVSGFSPQQLSLLECILATPEMRLALARMTLETDLASLTDAHFHDRYNGPSDHELLDCVLPCLSEEERPYWEGLRRGPGDMLHNEIMPILFVFEARLKRTGIEEIAT